MRKNLLWHQAKSEYAYAYDEHTLHITIRTGKNDLSSVILVHGDPFLWSNREWIHDKTPMIKKYQTSMFDYYFLAIHPKHLRTKYAFLLIDQNNHTFLYGSKRTIKITSRTHTDLLDLQNYFNYPYINFEDLPHTPKWVKDTVWYQIFPDRFHSSNGNSILPWGKLPVYNHELYGGNLRGVIDKLPYLQELGITGIYFTPIFEAPSAHKYDTVNYFKIDPSFGTNEDFKALVQSAHQFGIKVVLDGVFNHAGFGHPFFLDVVEKGENSLYKDCFFINKFPAANFNIIDNRPSIHSRLDLNYETFATTPHMPKWNTSNPITEKHLLDCVEYWIKEYDIDGWRLDVSNEVSHDFLRKIKLVSRNAKKDTFIFGENWDSSLPWLKGDQFDSVMNYDLSTPLWNFLENKVSLKEFKDMINTYLATTPKNIMENMFNLIGSHDTIRIKRRLKDQTERVMFAFSFMFLSAGAPNIYYGDEVGMTGEHDPDNRRCMLWNEANQDLEFKSFIKRLIALRKDYPVFSSYDYHFIDSPILSFTKHEGKDQLLVLYNHKKTGPVSIDQMHQGSYLNLITNEKVQLGDFIHLRKYEHLILLKEAQ